MDILVHDRDTGNNTVFKQIDSQLAAVLIAAGIAQPYRQQEPVSIAPRYFVGTSSVYTGAKAIIRQIGSAVEYLAVAPEKVKQFWPNCPDEVIAAWKNIDARQRATLG